VAARESNDLAPQPLWKRSLKRSQGMALGAWIVFLYRCCESALI